MAKVTGIGGIFLRSTKRKELIDWYKDHLGIDPAEGFAGAVFPWRDHGDPAKEGSTILGLFEHDTDYFGPENPPFMVNFRVDDLDAMRAQLTKAGFKVDEKVQQMDGIGRFGWVTDPEGRLVELWEPEESAE